MERHIQIARMITDLLENKFRIGKFRFGFDPVLGVIPGFGDIVTTVLSLYIVWIGISLRIPQEKIMEMVGNVVVDFLIGLLPVVGDMTDFVYKANSRNMKIIEQYAFNIIDGTVYQTAKV